MHVAEHLCCCAVLLSFRCDIRCVLTGEESGDQQVQSLTEPSQLSVRDAAEQPKVLPVTSMQCDAQTAQHATAQLTMR